MLKKHESTFSKDEHDLGLTDVVHHSIDTGDSKPIKQPPRRVPIALAGEELKAIKMLEKQNVIQKSSSPWSSPILLVKKKNGQVRPCVDYRKLNAVTLNDAFPLPRIQDCLMTVSGAKYFSTLDLTAGYHQVPMNPPDIQKTAFVTKYGLYEFTKLPFGLCNGTATFQRMMEIVLNGLQWQTCLIYLDDVIVFGRDFEEHLDRLSGVLDRIQKAGLKLQPAKCHILKKQVSFLGHLVCENGVLPHPDNIAKIVQWPRPQNVTRVRQILGMGSYYRRFIHKYSELVNPLVKLTRKSVQFEWTQECENSFNALKSVLTGSSILSYPRDEGEYILDTDASEIGIGAVLSQVHDGQEKVIAYGSRTLGKHERNYCITDKELLALRYFVEHFRQYLLGVKFLVRTDHRALKWLFSLKEPSGRIERWIEVLSSYDFSIEFRKGEKHGNADAMSRCENPRDCTCYEFDTEEIMKCGPCKKCQKRSGDMVSSLIKVQGQMDRDSFDMAEGELKPTRVRAVETRSQHKKESESKLLSDVTKNQKEDEIIGLVYEWVENQQRPTYNEVVKLCPEIRHYWSIFQSLTIQDEQLYKVNHRRDGTGSHLQILVPQNMREDVMFHMHNNIMSGHFGTKRMIAKVKQHYYWYEMSIDIKLWVARCDTCAANKLLPKTPKAPLGDMRVGASMDRLATDFIGPLPLSDKGNRFILVVMDHFSKWIEVIPVPDQSAVTTATVILNEVICRFGCPIFIHSDRGKNYESQIFRELCRMLEIKKTRSSVRHPKGNGAVERQNKTIITMVKKYLRGEQSEWDRNLGCIAAAYRASVHERTGMTPNFIMLGREVRLPIELLHGSSTNKEVKVADYGEYVDKLRSRIQYAQKIAREHLKVAASRQKTQHDARASVHKYKPGDLVWCLNEERRVEVSPKLQSTYTGPHLVIQKINDLNFKVQFDAKGKVKVLHHDKLKPYQGQRTLRWKNKAMKKL